MTTRIEIVVTNCGKCPFYNRGVMSAIADALSKDDRKTGICEYNARTRPGTVMSFFGVHVAEPEGNPPANCPLRGGETLVKLAGGV